MGVLRISKLDGLRGILALMILVFHYQQLMELFHPDVLQLPEWLYQNPWIKEWYSVVDFFFVLSGFVIAYNYETSLVVLDDFNYFIKKRLLRLYPLMLFTGITYLVFYVSFIWNYPQFYITVDPISHILFRFLDLLSLANATPIMGNNGPLNPPSWSISAEMVCYLIFGLFSVTPFKKYSYYFFAVIGAGAVIFCIYTGTFFYYSDFGFVRALINFILGCCVFRHYKKYPELKIGNYWELMFLVYLTGLIYFIHSFEDESVTKELIALVLVPTSYAVILRIFLATKGVLTSFFENRLMQFLGKISYSVYLTHYLWIQLIPITLFYILEIEQTPINHILVLLLTISFVIGYSNLTYSFVELSFTRRIKALFRF